MASVDDPRSHLRFHDLSHAWGHGTPVWPGFPGVSFERGSFHALHGTLTQRFTTTMHASTHINAPLHLVAGGTAMGAVPLDHFFGRAVVLSIPCGKWELIDADDLEAAEPAVEPGDIVLINTGWHRRHADSQTYFAHAPGLTEAAARWLIARKVKLLGMDTPAIDHPLATSLGPQRNGPLLPRLASEYQAETGNDPRAIFTEWQPAHRLLLKAGIPTIEELGGDIDQVSGRRMTVAALPYRWKEGDASIVRVVAIEHPDGDSAITGENGVLHDLTHDWGYNVSFWPGKNPIHDFKRHQFHSRDGAQVLQFTTVMHRGTHMDCPLHVLPETPDITGFELWKCFGTGVVLSIPKGRWEVITAEDLEQATPSIKAGDIVIINTGYHKKYGDDPDYYAYSPGLYKEAAEWLVARGVKMVGIDVQALDHPLGTYLGPHGPGPIQPLLNDEYKAETGRDIIDDFPHWEPAHKTLLSNGIPGIENVGGDLDRLSGKRMTLMAFPWRWTGGDGSWVRVAAIEEQ
jgi:kynurenine formamidase